MSTCPSIHRWSDTQCIRKDGHDGQCWGKAMLCQGAITRANWFSVNGQFKSHAGYTMIYPRNVKRPA